MEEANNIGQFLESMELKELPEIFLRNWDASMNIFPGKEIWFLKDSYIAEANKVLFLGDEKLKYFYAAIDIIRSNIDLCRYVWLWHYCLFISEPFPAFNEILGWPFPEIQMGAMGQMFHGVVLISGLEWLARFYKNRSIPAKIMTDTLSEFDICLDEHKAKYGEYGIGIFRTSWLLNHFSGSIFRLGRLEYINTFFTFDHCVYQNVHDGRIMCIKKDILQDNPAFIKGHQLLLSGYFGSETESLPVSDWKLVLGKGDRVLQVHITIGERLSTDASRKSLTMAIDFYAEHFPDMPFKLFTCDSWLLNPQLVGLLPETSNIVNFQKLFHLYPGLYEEADVFRFAFDVYKKPDDLSVLPERSSLHMILKAYLMKGNHISSSGGFIFKEECCAGKDNESYKEIYLRCCGKGGSMTSRERVLAAIKRDHVDYVPCSPFYNDLCPEQRVGYKYQFPWGPSDMEMVEYNATRLGLDPVISIDVTGYEAAPGVTSRIWLENDILHKIYTTPAGEIHAAVKYNAQWPHGMNIPFYSDFNVGHYVEPWIKSINDVECLKHIMVPAKSNEYNDKLTFSHNRAKTIADKYNLATVCPVGLGLTGAMHLFGVENLCIATVEETELVDRYLEFEHRLNLHFIEIATDIGIDIIMRNGFYETCDFYSPQTLKSLLGRRLKEEIDLVHKGGKVIGYVLNTGVMQMLDYLDEMDFDCIVKMDIAFRDLDLKEVKHRLGDKKSFWIGPSAVYHIAEGSGEDVRKAVRTVYDIFGKKGLIISACPSSHSIMPWENTFAMIEEWRKLRIYP